MAVSRRAFLIDTGRCINCKTCEIACKDINQAARGVRLRRVRTFETGDFPHVLVRNFSMSCNHCEDPLCLRHCPAKAYSQRPDGIVVHHRERCIGCRYCTWVCPYGAPQYDSQKGCVHKCNFCYEELDRGNEPACVSGCPTRAISVQFADEAADAVIDAEYLPSSAMTKPTSRYRVPKEIERER